MPNQEEDVTVTLGFTLVAAITRWSWRRLNQCFMVWILVETQIS